MLPRTPGPADKGHERVRNQLLTALHLGRLEPGDRVPSVRRMAQLTGLDRKTVHRAYLRLAASGLLRARRGSGTFVAPDTRAGAPAPGLLLAAVDQFRAEATALGLTTEQFGSFLSQISSHGLRGLPLAVAECNMEQLGLIAREVREAFGAAVLPLPLADPVEHGAVLHRVAAVVTTECHRDEVGRLAAPFGVPVYRVALDPEHAQTLLRHARRGPVILAVRDRRYDGALRRLFAQLGVPPEVAQRCLVLEPEDARHALKQFPDAVLHVSPLVDAAVLHDAARGVRRLAPRRYLDQRSLERLRAQLVLERVLAREAPAPRVAVPAKAAARDGAPPRDAVV
ncbi:MAG: GntR family transcriptional regulator [Acidobacteria bacterium]|nr:GntR family transcriptional regulator [Acidobacteriota bacterium]